MNLGWSFIPAAELLLIIGEGAVEAFRTLGSSAEVAARNRWTLCLGRLCLAAVAGELSRVY